MVIKVKEEKIHPKNNLENDSNLISDIINRGGKTPNEKSMESDEIRFTFRISRQLLELLDQERKKYKWGRISRNQWILETIKEKISASL